MVSSSNLVLIVTAPGLTGETDAQYFTKIIVFCDLNPRNGVC